MPYDLRTCQRFLKEALTDWRSVVGLLIIGTAYVLIACLPLLMYGYTGLGQYLFHVLVAIVAATIAGFTNHSPLAWFTLATIFLGFALLLLIVFVHQDD